MRCDEIQERLIELLYDENSSPQADSELRAHVLSCPTCRNELEELKAAREMLKVWQDEPLPSPVIIPAMRRPPTRMSAFFSWRMPGFAAVAAMLILVFLVLANAEITWNKEGFAYRSRIFAGSSDSYTKAEVRDVLKRVLDDSEARMTETSFLMMQRLLDTLEQDQAMQLRFVRGRSQNRN
jgi:predicted anti-sigma-YlaC factor YlaD